MWKVTNISKPAQDIKIAARRGNDTVGVILKPNQFCVVDNQITSAMDAQSRRGFISIDRGIDNKGLENTLKLNLCEAYDVETVETARKQAVAYKGK